MAKSAKNLTYEDVLSAETARGRAEFEAQVEAALAPLAEDAVNSKNLAKRHATIRAIADADADPMRSRDDALKEKGVVSRSTFYSKDKDWFANDLFRATLERVCALTLAYEGKKDQRQREARRQFHREKMLETANSMIDKVGLMLDFPLSSQRIDTETGAVIVEAVRWQMRDVAPIVNAADKAARLALEMDTKREVHEIKDLRSGVVEQLRAGNVLPEDVVAAYPEQADAWLAEAGISAPAEPEGVEE